MSLLLDTHVLVWWLGAPVRLSAGQRAALEGIDAEHPALVADISLWEIAMLVGRGRLVLDLPLRDWLEAATAPPLVRRIGITPAIAAEVAAIPDSFHGDPADRILVATARVLGASLVTRDERILTAGLVATIS